MEELPLPPSPVNPYIPWALLFWSVLRLALGFGNLELCKQQHPSKNLLTRLLFGSFFYFCLFVGNFYGGSFDDLASISATIGTQVAFLLVVTFLSV